MYQNKYVLITKVYNLNFIGEINGISINLLPLNQNISKTQHTHTNYMLIK